MFQPLKKLGKYNLKYEVRNTKVTEASRGIVVEFVQCLRVNFLGTFRSLDLFVDKLRSKSTDRHLEFSKNMPKVRSPLDFNPILIPSFDPKILTIRDFFHSIGKTRLFSLRNVPFLLVLRIRLANYYLQNVQEWTMRPFQGWVNFDPAVAYH